jgi:maleate isomerase
MTSQLKVQNDLAALPIRHIDAELDPGYAQLRKIGLIVLSTDLVSEYECRAMCPKDGVLITATRIHTTNPLTVMALQGHIGQIADAAARYDPIAEIHSFAYSCTSGSAANRREDFDASLASVGSSARLTSPLYGALEAFKSFGIKRVAMLTPYPDDVVQLMAQYLAVRGVEPVALGSFHFDIDYEIMAIAPQAIFDAAVSLDVKEAEACFIPCTGLRTSSIIEKLERRLNKPVVTAHQAMLWHALRLAGYPGPIDGFGRLMRH